MKTKNGLNPQKSAGIIFSSIITAIFMVCCFMTSCNSKEDLLNPASDDAGDLTSKSLQCGRVFTVSPSGNFNDDSYNIQTALDAAVVAGPGCTVQMTKGTFYLKERIEVEGFDGSIKGAGKDKTIITTHDAVNFNIPSGDQESLIKFRHGKIKMSDLTIKISNPNPCIGLNNNENWLNALPSIIMVTGSSIENPGGKVQPVSFNFNNLKFVGGVGNYWDNRNLCYFIYVCGDGSIEPYTLKGEFKVTNCEFHSAVTGIASFYTTGPYIIGGSEASGNIFTDASWGVGIMDINNSSCNISFNHFSNMYHTAVELWQGGAVDPTLVSMGKYTVFNNDIEVNSSDPSAPGFTNAVRLVDIGLYLGLDKKMEAVVADNKIYMNNIGFAGILIECCEKARITNNKIWGNGLAGIIGGIWDEPSDGGFLKGNNVHGVIAQVAPIWLGPLSSNYVVYADKSDVLDEGTGNILIGEHNKRSGHPGPDIMEKMMRQHDKMNLHKHPGMH
jgi:hypothetical protein